MELGDHDNTPDLVAGLAQRKLDLGDAEDSSRVVTPYDDSLASLLSACGGLRYSNVPASSVPVPSFRGIPYIPIIDDARLLGDTAPSWIAVYLEDILTNDCKHAKTDIRTSLKIPNGTKLLVLVHGNDEILRKFAPHEFAIYEELAKQNIQVAVSPNWSAWANHNVRTQRINQKRSLRGYQRIDQEGIPAIPHFFLRYGSIKNIEETARWINEKTTVQTVALNLQTYKEDDDWYRIIAALHTLKSRLTRKVHFLIIGPSTFPRIDEITKIFGAAFTLINTQPAKKAAHYREIRLKSSGLVEVSYIRKPDNQVELIEGATTTPLLYEIFTRSCNAYSKLVIERSLQNTWPDIMQETEQALTMPAPKKSRASSKRRR